MTPPPDYGQDATLVPLSGIQFLDFAARFDAGNRIEGFSWEPRWFAEQRALLAGAETEQLLELRRSEDGLVDVVTGAAVEEEDAYALRLPEVLAGFERRWVPIPYFRVLGVDARRVEVHDQGPTNWARLYLTRLATPDEAGNTHRMVIAFDTDVEDGDRDSGADYVMPTRLDARTEDRFGLSAAPADLNWFVDQPWMDDWLRTEFAAASQGRRRPPPQDDAPPRALEYIARYIVLIQTLAAVARLPRIRLIDIFSEQLNYHPIPVDLIVDVGNSRTCGILIETQGEGMSRLDLSRSDPLSLRDLSRPETMHGDAFQSRVEFSRAFFGDEGISRRSGRKRSFQWPSLVRIGPEAARLSVGGSGTDGATGMSSPKRYLWDNRTMGQVWRTRRPERGDTEVVSGPLLRLVSESGELLGRRRPGSRREPLQPAIRPRFSRSSLFMMLVTEILAQAISRLNAPDRRGRQSHSDVPRYLRDIVLTLPPATPLAERRIMAERVEDAITLVWKALGWDEPPRAETVRRPAVRINLDEATATQLVYLYTEIAQKYGGDPRGFLSLVGKPRAEHGAEPTLRVASIDIGGGTSDLIVVSYALQPGTRRTLLPSQDFREGFRLAGDDIVHATIAHHVLFALEQALERAGVPRAKPFLRELVGADRGGMSEQERQFRRRFTLQLLEPVALALLGQLEGRPGHSENAPLTQRLGEAWTSDPAEAGRIAAEFDALARRAGAVNFTLADVEIEAMAEELSGTVRATIAPALEPFAEVIASLDCDVLLLSGRPSRLPVIADILVATLATRPDRIVPMHHYRAGKWYPFRDAFDRITDPKTTVAVGAMLCAFAQGQIEDFKVETSALTVRSTARYIGQMKEDKIKAEDVLFGDIDLEDARGAPREKTLSAETLTTTIGFRQLPLQRWPASPLYAVEVGQSAEARQAVRFPVAVTITQGGAFAGHEDEALAQARYEDFVVSGFADVDGERPNRLRAECRLQTMKDASGYWLDTGIISAY